MFRRVLSKRIAEILSLSCTLGSTLIVHARQDCPQFEERRATFEVTGTVDEIARRIADEYSVSVCVEEAPRYCWHLICDGGPGCDGVMNSTLKADNLTLGQALDSLTREDKRYIWNSLNCEVVNLIPRGAVDDPDNILSKELGKFRIANRSPSEVILAVGDILERQYQVRIDIMPRTTVFSGSPESFEEYLKHMASLPPIENINIFWQSGNTRDILNEMASRSSQRAFWRTQEFYTLLDEESERICGGGPWFYSYYVDFMYYKRDDSRKPFSIRTYKPGVLRPQTKETPCSVGERREVEIIDQPIEDAVLILWDIYDVPIYFESVLWRCRDRDGSCSNRSRVTINGSMTLTQALDELVDKERRYDWTNWDCRAINVYPKYQSDDPYYLLNLTMDRLNRDGETVYELVERISAQLRERNRVLSLLESVKPGEIMETILEPLRTYKISMQLEGLTIREILNESFDAFNGELGWQVQRWVSLDETGDKSHRACGQEAHQVLVPVVKPSLACGKHSEFCIRSGSER